MPRLTPPLPAARARGGFTLAELLVALVLLSIVGGALFTTLRRQQRFYNHAGEVIEQRSQLRQAASILPADFRAISSPGRDLIAMGATSVRLLTNFGSAVICARPAGLVDDTFDVPPLHGVRNTYTVWSTPPEPGDSVVIFDEGARRGSEDDQWLRFAVAQITADVAYCPAPHIYIDATEDARPRYRVRVALPGQSVTTDASGVTVRTDVLTIPATVVSPGAVVRFLRPVEYSLFQSAQNGKFYLGLSEFRAGVWSTRNVVSGPYQTTGSGAGVSFRYFTEGGVAVSSTGDPKTVARIDMTIRGASDARNQFSRTAGGRFADSLAVRVALRNRR